MNNDINLRQVHLDAVCHAFEGDSYEARKRQEAVTQKREDYLGEAVTTLKSNAELVAMVANFVNAKRSGVLKGKKLTHVKEAIIASCGNALKEMGKENIDSTWAFNVLKSEV